MQMTGEQRVAAPRDKVWEALNDPEVLRASIPGCQSLAKEGDGFVATVEVKIGPIGARFKGAVTISHAVAAEGYTLSGEGAAGIAGSAKGSAKVRLSDAGDGATLVSYQVDSQVSGRLAQLGGPLIDATAKNLSGKFFTKFGEIVGGVPAVADAPAAASVGAVPAAAPVFASAMPGPARAPRGTLWGWIAALIVALIAGFVLGQAGAPGSVFLTMAILLVVTAAAAFEAGRRGSRA
jgi:carbon monoxide dehydrogenase subunit G